MPVCSTCELDKIDTDFYKRSRGAERFKQCKTCFRAKQKEYKEELWQIIFGKYGKTCQCCGETERKFLTLDHINNDGAAQRKRDGNKGGYALWLWLINNDLPEGFQTLCWNCNCAKGFYGACPHTKCQQN